MNIYLDFTTIACDLDHINPYTNKKCEICGEEFGESVSGIDPKVELRKKALRPIYTVIEAKKKERKDWFSKFRTGGVKKEYVSAPFDRISLMISRLSSELEKGLFDDINLSSDNLGDENLKIEIDNFADFMGSIYDILIQSERLDCKMVWKNMNNRLASALRLYISGYENFIDAAISLNYQSALELQTAGQKTVDLATNEITILGKIIENQNISLNYDLFKDGQLNQSPIFAMVFNSGEETVSQTIEKTSALTHYYFSDFLIKSYDEMEKSHLLSLSVYRYMGTSAFDDSEYRMKIKASLDVINKAYIKDPNRYKSFFSLYLEKFLYMQKKLYEFSMNFSYIVGNHPSDELLMQNSIKWYKDLSEGVYREASRLVYFSLKLINNKQYQDEDILTWLGFGDIVGEFEQQVKLNKLTEGVERIIRNSEAHVDYDIDNNAGLIIVRNVDVRNKKQHNKEFTYEEFFDVTNKLAETIFSIISSIKIFIYNNSNDFFSEIQAIEEHEEKLNKINNAVLLFAMSGIIIEEEKKKISNSNGLSLRGKLVNEINLKELGNRIFNVCALISMHEFDIEVIHVSLVNENEDMVGKVDVNTKYLKLYQSDHSNFKDYYLILAKLTSDIDEVFTDNVTNDNDLICLKSIFYVLLEQLVKVDHAFRDRRLMYNSRIKSEIKMVVDEIELLERMVFIYKEHAKDLRLTTHLEMVLNQVKKPIINLSKNGMTTLNIELQFKNIKAITNLFQEYTRLVYGEITLETYLRNYIRNYCLSTKIGVNEPCPCGSGKKFKKCCRH